MADILPTDVYPNYVLVAAEAAVPAGSAHVCIPLSDLASLSEAEANATTGDGRSLLYALIQHAYENFAALADGDKPTKMTLSKSAPAAIGQLDQVRQAYSASFDISIAPSTNELVDEPA